MRVFLTGFMGAGKTAVGLPLARRLCATFVDLDREIEKEAGARVPEIFARSGEAEFRRLEASALRATAHHEDAVVATGGGVVESEENREWMRAHGMRVWLKPDFEALLRRVGTGEGRPLFQNPKAAKALYTRRLSAYGECELEIEVAADETVEETVEKIARTLGEMPCAT